MPTTPKSNCGLCLTQLTLTIVKSLKAFINDMVMAASGDNMLLMLIQ